MISTNWRGEIPRLYVPVKTAKCQSADTGSMLSFVLEKRGNKKTHIFAYHCKKKHQKDKSENNKAGYTRVGRCFCFLFFSDTGEAILKLL